MASTVYDPEICSGDALLGSITTADVGGTDKELEPGCVSELLVVVDVVE